MNTKLVQSVMIEMAAVVAEHLYADLSEEELKQELQPNELLTQLKSPYVEDYFSDMFYGGSLDAPACAKILIDLGKEEPFDFKWPVGSGSVSEYFMAGARSAMLKWIAFNIHDFTDLVHEAYTQLHLRYRREEDTHGGLGSDVEF